MTQLKSIREYLDTGRSLTPLDALAKFSCFALSQRIGELERKGYPIQREWKELASGKRIREYRRGT
jgi:hypothetical protein